ncbi:PREDICTED: synaptotagmin-10 [Aptenodytes forsteri]|uniref:synaptotagmin-10 n=1 Tax=Aptenodytes forsteri TaxID=9233 RepID=UPI0004F44577|nr:PREDICTED: synaptotagmin-10 [Aptenodytes forsteri]
MPTDFPANSGVFVVSQKKNPNKPCCLKEERFFFQTAVPARFSQGFALEASAGFPAGEGGRVPARQRGLGPGGDDDDGDAAAGAPSPAGPAAGGRSVLPPARCADLLCFVNANDRAYPRSRAALVALVRIVEDISVSLLAVVVSFCGLALLVVSLFVFWKLCWPCWRSKPLTSNASNVPQSNSSAPTEVFETSEKKEVKENGKPTTKVLEAALKISHTSPDIPAEVQNALKEHLIRHARMQRQITEPTSSSRHNSFRRHLPRQMQVSSVDFNMGTDPILQRGETTTSIGRIKPELYKQKSVDSDGQQEDVKTCGKLNFTLRYDYENELLAVTIVKALDLPAKDFTGTSDPYVKIYLLPDRKKKFQTRVHRKTLNPVFDETFQFPVAYDQLSNRKLHFSVYDFDRFSRHDMIGEVILDNLFEVSDLSREANVWKDIHCATTESIDLGEIMFSLCYLPTAGRMTFTVIKCRNLKAMDITGASDPYVKVSLMCEGRRLKKRKTTTKKNTLNPVYNEAIIFDIPPENVDQVSLSIAVMDYDRVGHNEVIGVCRTGIDAEGLGRDHWNEMLAYPRKPITHWHPLVELPGRATSFDSQGSCSSPKPPLTP